MRVGFGLPESCRRWLHSHRQGMSLEPSPSPRHPPCPMLPRPATSSPVSPASATQVTLLILAQGNRVLAV